METNDLEFGFVERVIEDNPLYVAPALHDVYLRAAALRPFAKVKQRALPNIIDANVLAMMHAAEHAMTLAGDVYAAFQAEIAVGMGDIIVTHQDDSVQREYREWMQRLDATYWVHDALLTTSIYGNAFTVALQDNGVLRIANLNPKRVAVGRTAVGAAVAWFGDSQEEERFFHKAQTPAWNEWQDIVDGGGLPLDPNTVHHTSTVKPNHQRYGLPRVIYAWSDITTRATLDGMVRATIEGVRNQIRLWRIKTPTKNEIAALKAELRANRADRAQDIVWDDRLTVEVIMPGVVDSLLAGDTWMRLTASIFRKLGMNMRLVSQPVTPAPEGRQAAQEAEVLVQMIWLRQRVQLPALALAQRIVRWIAEYGDPALARFGLPTVRIRESPITVGRRMRDVYVPLLNFGLVSTRTVHEDIGLDHEAEIQRLQDELALRQRGVIRPYTGFAQEANGRTVEHRQSPGRPAQPDLDPDHSAQNQENARG